MGAWAISTLRQVCLEGPSDPRDPVSLEGLARTVFIHLYAPGLVPGPAYSGHSTNTDRLMNSKNTPSTSIY